MWNFKKFTSGFAAMAVAATAFVAVPISAGAATQALSWVLNDGTYGYGTAITNSPATYLNTTLDSTTVSGAMVNQSRGSGMYTTFSEPLLPCDDILTIEFGLDIAGGSVSGSAGDTTQTVCFMSNTYTPSGRTLQSVPSSDVLFKLSKTTNGKVYLNSTEILSTNNTEKPTETSFGTETVRNVTGLVKYKVVLDFAQDTVSLYADTGSGYPSTAISDSLLTTDATGLYGIFVNSTNKRAYSGIVMTDITYPDVYTVTANDSDSATVSVDKTKSLSNSTITVTATPKENYTTPVTIVVTDASGNPVSTTSTSDTKATFIMPESNVNVTATATVEVLTGHVLKTTPYALISIDGGSSFSSGRLGEYQFDVSDTSAHSITITKPNYVSKENISVTTLNNSSTDLTLTPESGIVYYEGFDYVEDNFGFSENTAIVSNGVLSRGQGYVSTSLPESVDIEGKLVTIRLKLSAISRHGDFDFGGINIHDRLERITAAGMSTGNGIGVAINKEQYYDMQVYVPSSTSDRYSFYVDGLKYTEYDCAKYSADKAIATTVGLGSQYSMTTSVDYMKVSDKPADRTVTIIDEGTENKIYTYLDGSSFKLPSPAGVGGKTFKGWSVDGTNPTIEVGEEVTVSSNVTYTAIYESNTGTITPKYVAANGNTQLGGTIASDGTGGANGSTIATAFALDTTNVPQETTMTGIAWEINVPNNGAYVRTNNTSNWTKTVEGSPVTYIDSENGIASGVENYNIYPVSTSFTLRLMHQLPHVTGAEVIVGLVVDNLYIPSNSTVTANYITTAYNASDEAYAAYDKLDLGTLTDGVYNATVGTSAALSETTAFGELMSIDSILTMMYDEDELAEITGDIASEDNANITGIDDEIDMTDNNDGGEAVGEME